MPPAFLGVALVYAAVGFGGGSSYLALLILAGTPTQRVPALALVCNLVVASGGVWHFHQRGHLRAKRLMPFLAASVPMAALGGSLKLGERTFSLILGSALLAVALCLFFRKDSVRTPVIRSTRTQWVVGLPVGAGLGFLAGLTGIGGGVFLSPLWVLAGWAEIKETSAAASLFILVNSTAGLGAQLLRGPAPGLEILVLMLVVLAGGQIGSRLGAGGFPRRGMQRVLSFLVGYVSLRLLRQAL